MTKNFKSYILSALAVAAIAFTGCSKNDEGMPEVQKKGFSVTLSGVSTKTTNDGMSTLWAANDAINLFHSVCGEAAITYVSDGKFSTAQSGTTAVFTGDLAESFDETKTYNWYAFYPYVSQKIDPENTTAGYTYVGGRSDRAQTQTGNNSTAHISGTNYPVAGVCEKLPGTEKPLIIMRHLSSLVAVKVTNGLKADPITVTKVSITADEEDIVGSYFINFANPFNPTFVPSRADFVSNTANLVVTEGEEIPAGASATFYLAVKPFTVNEGDDFTVSVTATNGEQEKVISADKNYTFAAGKMKTINFSYDKSEVTYDFTTVAELNAIAAEVGTTPTDKFGELSRAIVTFVSPDTKTVIISDGTASIMYYNNSGTSFKQGQTYTGDVNVTVLTYNGLYSEVNAINATFEGEGRVVEPQGLTLEQVIGHYAEYQNAYVKMEELEVTAINGKNISVTDGTNTYIVYLNDGTTTAVVGDKITAIGTITKYGTPAIEELKVWKAEDITITSHTATEHAINIVQPTDAGTSYITVTVGGSEITSGTKVMEGTEVKAEITIDGDYDFTTWDITGATPSSPLSHVITFKVGTEDITIKANLVKRGAKSYTITWNPTNNSQSIGSYTATWSVTAEGLTCNMVNWNNNSNKWNFVKCGRKDNASVATITTASAISEAIKKVTMTIDALTASKINSITLYVSGSADSGWTSVGTFTKATGDQSVTIASPAANKYYKLEVDCAAGTSNGLLTLSKLVFSE